MALEIKLKVQEAPGGTEIWIWDHTGVYHPVNNPTGWGGANPDIQDITDKSLFITLPDLVTLEVSADPAKRVSVTVPAGFPNVLGTKLVVLNTDLGLNPDESFIDGEYEFQFSVSGTVDPFGQPSNFTGSWRSRFIFFNDLYCCVEKAKAKVNLEDSSCKPCRDTMFDVLILDLGLQGVIANNACAKTNQALAILKEATSRCEKAGCKGCN